MTLCVLTCNVFLGFQSATWCLNELRPSVTVELNSWIALDVALQILTNLLEPFSKILFPMRFSLCSYNFLVQLQQSVESWAVHLRQTHSQGYHLNEECRIPHLFASRVHDGGLVRAKVPRHQTIKLEVEFWGKGDAEWGGPRWWLVSAWQRRSL